MHKHEFTIRDNGSDDENVYLIVEGAVNGARYCLDFPASAPGYDGDGCYGASVNESVAGCIKSLRHELEPLRPELTGNDYREFAESILDDAQSYAEEHFRESTRRYTPA